METMRPTVLDGLRGCQVDEIMVDAGHLTTVEKPRSVCDLIEKWAGRNPSHTAILCEEGRRVSYRDLDDAACRIAWLLQQKGVRSGDLVPVLATRSPEMIASFLGILKAGACYVPIDIEAWSEDRIESTLRRVSARVVVDLGGRSGTLPDCDLVSCHEVEAAFWPAAAGQEPGPEPGRELAQSQIRPEDLAYIIFTSGTTSTPKGVMIPHRALLNYVQQGDEEAPFNANATPEDITLLIFSPGFDACTGLVFSTLCNGAQVMIPSSADFLGCVTRVTILTATPSVLAAIQDPQTCPKLRTIVLGGEAPPPWLIRKWWAPGRNIYNAYGPTETTICSSIGRVYPDKSITLGRSMSNSRVLLLDGEAESDQGEICITGPGLALGYYQDEMRTAKAFVYWRGERMYRTGDFARRTEHGLEFAGRADSLVKNRGFLVNLESEVIPMLLGMGAGVLTATAFMHRNRLVAFVTPDSLDTLAFRQILSTKHDTFLVPDQIYAMEALPLTVNGKVDNRALQQLLEAEAALDKDNNDDAEVSPPGDDKSKMAILKAAITAATLLPASEVASDRPFWELGGNSLAALKVLSYLRRRGLMLSIKALFDLPNLSAVCDAMQVVDPATAEREETFGDGEEDQDQDQEASTAPMTALQVKMLEASLRTPGANYMLLRIHLAHPGANLDRVSLREAWLRVLQRHAIFRTAFSLRDELQQVLPKLELDWSDEETTTDQLDAVVLGHSLEIRSRMLSVDEQSESFVPVNAFRLITVPGLGSTLLTSAHHAQADGWSLSIVLDEVRSVLDGKVPLPSRRPPQFASVALAQKQQQINPEGVAFWNDILQGHAALPRLSLPKPLADSTTGPSDEWTSSLEIALGLDGARLEDGARVLRVTPSSLVYAAWALVLSNYTSSERVAFGAVFSGRNLMAVPGVERVVGPLLNTVPFPVTFDEERRPTIATTVSDINSQLLQMLEYQWSATEATASMAGESINGALQSIVVTEYDLPPLPESWTVERQDLMEFGLSLLLERDDNDSSSGGAGLRARVLFDSSRYAPSGIRRLLSHFKNALRELMNPHNEYIQSVRAKLMDEDEKSSLIRLPAAATANVDKGAYTGPTTVKDAFEAAADQWPDLCAVESARHGSMTYRELDQASNKVARWLRQSLTEGKRPQDVVVGILTDGSLHWVVSILAAFKAGCVCCAIDISLPPKRIETVVEQSGASVFLAANQVCAQVLHRKDSGGTVVIVVDEFLKVSPTATPTGPLETATQAKDTVYLVFTSGSTGVPKGVPLHNMSILYVIDNPHVRLFAAPGRRIAQLFGLGFDVVLVELFGSLCYGATLVLKDAADPFEHLGRVHATMATPSLLSACSPDDYGNLDTIALAGEPVPQSLADAWAGRVHLMNLYGPSECGPISTGTRLLPGEPVSIGRPLPQLSVYVLDHRMCPVPPEVTGEIYISGDQMTRGYWNDSAEAQSKALFVPNPFSSRPEQQLMYRTGDLGFWNPDMTLCYVGRLDNQVKVRGFRIELEEIERALVAVGGGKVQSAAAVTISGGHSDGARIVAFVTPEVVDTAALRAGVATLLPSYARPARIVSVAELPKSANFKVDRKALASLAACSRAEEADSSDGVNDFSTGPLTPTEKLVAETWKELLGLGDDARVRKDDDFLALGGNSLLAIRAARRIASSIDYHVPVALLIRETVLEALSRAIDQHHAAQPTAAGDSFSSYWSSARRAALAADYSSTALPMSHLEADMYHAHTVSDTRSAFNTTVQLVLQGHVDTEALAEAFTAIVRENPILRSRYVISKGQPARLVSPEALAPQYYVDDELNPERLRAWVGKSFDLARDQLFRVVIWTRNGGDERAGPETDVVMVTHHIITDKASLALMLQLVGRKYRYLTGSEEWPATNGHEDSSHAESSCYPAAGDATYIDWAQWLQLRQESAAPKSQLHKKDHIQFWKQHLGGMQPIPHLHRSESRGKDNGSTRSISIPYLDAASVPRLSGQQQLYSQRLAVAATALALRAVYGSSDMVLGLPYMNRDEPGTADMLGLFVDQLPIRLVLGDDGNLASAYALLDAVAAEINLAIDHQLPYAQIRSATTPVPPKDENMIVDDNIVDVMVLYHWQSDALEKSLSLGPGVRIYAKSADYGAAKPAGALFPLLLEYSELEDGSLHVEIEYSTRVVSSEGVTALASFLPTVVQALARRTMPEPSIPSPFSV